MAMVHTEGHFIQIGITVILCDGRPSVTEGIEMVEVFLLHSHVRTNSSDTDVYTCIEAVGIRETAVKYEKVFIVFIGRKVFVKGSLNEGFHPHFDVASSLRL